MQPGKRWLKKLVEQADFMDESVTLEPILELCGNRRILIEQHCGVLEYSAERITVKIKNGTFTVIGEGLDLCKMCSAQLLIRGRIESVQVRKGRGA